jgi:peptidoglycan-N-acetylglucosamine deacetylase
MRKIREVLRLKAVGFSKRRIAAVGAYWVVFQVLETSAAALAMLIDRKRATWRLLPLLLLQRFCYRQLRKRKPTPARIWRSRESR